MSSSSDPIDPVLASRPRRLWLTGLMALAGVAGTGFILAGLTGWPDLPGVTAADAQNGSNSEGKTSDRVAQAHASDDAGTEEHPELRNNISRQAREWGVKTCLGQVSTLSDFLTANQTYSALSRRGGPEADASAFSATIAARDRSGLDSISTFVSAPVSPGECQSTYQTVAGFPASCDEVRRKQFQAFTEELEFGDRVEARHNGRGSYVYFLPVTEAACVIVKTQLVR